MIGVNANGEWKNYKGPMGSWVRLTSNGVGYETGPYKNREGFIFYGGKDFYSDYGFSTDTQGKLNSTIGFQTDKLQSPHYIENNIHGNSPIFVASPEIERITVVIQKELFRKATIEWVCFSKAQLEYMTPYFLVPHISCLVEWGWNHYNSECMLDVSDISLMTDIMNNPYQLYTNNILKSNGNYDVIRGIISDFDWSIEGNKIKCRTEISSPDRIYSGLVLNSTVEELPSAKATPDDSKLPYGDLTKFITDSMGLLISIGDKTSKLSHAIGFLSPTARPSSKYNLVDANLSSIIGFIQYLKRSRPTDWRTYLYGIFYGRNTNKVDGALNSKYSNSSNDFDIINPSKNLWLNLGLVVEILNYHASKLKMNRDCEMFKIDINDIEITGHPNMISSDGSVLLIPNKLAPKYFFGGVLESNTNISTDDYKFMRNASSLIPITNDSGSFENLRLRQICLQGNTAYRDDLNELINMVRSDNSITGSFEFPSIANNCNSGFLKNLYINTSFLVDLTNNQDIKTYTNFIEKMLDGISSACGNYWDLRLVASSGNPDLNSQSTMKIVDYKYIGDDIGTPFTFNYMTDDSLLTATSFKPTLGNASAIRTMYASTNLNADNNTKLNNGKTELLDYHFKDRLFLNDSVKSKNNSNNFNYDINESLSLLNELQTLKPSDGMFQMTTYDSRPSHVNDVGIVRRLALPNPSILNMLLDDSNFEESTNYTGIMPGIQASFTLLGIGGLRTFMMFLVDGLPEPYSSENIIFRITDVTESLDDGKWVTTIVAGIIPLRNMIRRKLHLPLNKKS